MTQHTDLIERLRASSEDGLTPDDAYAAAEALEAQAREIEGLRKDAERLDFIETAPEGCVRMDANSFCPSYIYWGKGDYYKEVTRNDTGSFCGPTLRAVLDAAMPQKGQP